ncbi:AaceriAGR291Cp [[Ashbya] aceris (nom. inval.)]|nr:AaceriAGR291Cp [[Ashbya] aceris (nom. inval.)]
MRRNLVVFGGTGFLGKRICQLAATSGVFDKVTSLSRSGRAPDSSEKWSSAVNWASCNIFDPATYQSHLHGATDVVHSVGILLENPDYKTQLASSPLGSLASLGQLVKPKWARNPLQQNNPQFTYDAVNRRTAMLLAETVAAIAKDSGAERKVSFSYISADKGFPLIPAGYINSKRQAEEGLMRLEHQLRPLLFRPGFMFDEARGVKDARSALRDVLELLNCGNELLLRRNVGCVNQLLRPTVSTQQVARALLKHIQDERSYGVVSLEDILKA